MRRYNPSAGGHAPGHLRGFFWAMLDLDEDEAEADWPNRLPSDRDPLEWVAGQLHNCTDAMPGDARDYFDGVRGSYAVGARYVLSELADPASLLSRGRLAREAIAERVPRKTPRLSKYSTP